MTTKWKPWENDFVGYSVAKMLFTDFAGSGYQMAKNRFGHRKFFFTYKAAQRFADLLNTKVQP